MVNKIAQYIGLCNNIAYVGATLKDCAIYSLIFKNLNIECTIKVTLCSLWGSLHNIPSAKPGEVLVCLSDCLYNIYKQSAWTDCLYNIYKQSVWTDCLYNMSILPSNFSLFYYRNYFYYLLSRRCSRWVFNLKRIGR